MESFQIRYLEKCCVMAEMRVGIVADDLTGAADSSAPFAQRGARCAIQIIDSYEDTVFSNIENVDVISISACCRDLPWQNAYSRFATALNALNERNTDLIFWKVDSTLRGHLIEQREMIHKQFPEKTLVICPAFPRRGRKVVGGELIAESIRQNVAEAFGLSQNSSHPQIYHSGCAHQLPVNPGKVIILDAENDEDLDRIAECIVDHPGRYIPIGSAGLSASIARRMWNVTPLLPSFQQEFTVVCIGSQHPVSRAQADALKAHPGTFNLPSFFTDDDLLKARKSNKRVVVWTSPEDMLAEMPQLPSIALLLGSKRVHIIATGGNTAETLCTQMKVNTLLVVSEIESGIAMTTDVKSQFHLTMKSGAFGDTNLLIRLAGLELQ